MPASGLAALQRYLVGAIRQPSSLVDDPRILAAEVEALVEPGPGGMTAVERLDVYREQFWYRHWESLAEDYPTVAFFLGGRAAFDRLAAAYLTATPPGTWNLQRLGQALPAFIAASEPWSEDPVLADAARLDWAFVRAFDARDAAPFDMQALAMVPAEAFPRAVLSFHPSLEAIALGHGVQETRRAVVRGESPGRPAAGDAFVAVWRDGANHLRDVDVERGAFLLWTAIASGKPLGAACESLARGLDPEQARALEEQVGRWFQEWAERGWIVDVRVE